ncbi:hypothetical protein BU23DRAFT_553814 [Bimuria novae-zelandiae CBS 107.79]|uniref:Uncharacterized protein n=1 Tax=Bimuria novae-zelandiae CBS 107.79 TaxID=1447943 RepID=A0A6A5VAJ1_9PLEO|nr:hypothetical protein BU23DRAFT_553814 [Bimuria novae-zelandiae CBS 107.79]
MAFLAHEIPWDTLSDLFEYSNGSEPGPQHPEIFPKSSLGQVKQLEYFASKFQAAVREHSATERKRHRPAKDYAERTQAWTASEKDSDIVGETSNVKKLADAKETDQDALKQRNAELRQLASDPWATSSPERRFIFPPDFANTYMSYVSIISGTYEGRQGLVEEFAHVEEWTSFIKRNADYLTCTSEERNRLWLDKKSCSDILRLLVIDAAITTDAQGRTRDLETILLLAHHPDVGISTFFSDGMSCCNIEVGLKSLVQKVALAFVYLNLLWTYVDGNTSSPLLQPREYVEKYEGASYRNERFTSLLPRPAYMNTKSFNGLLEEVLKEHGHVVEPVFFNPLFAPYESGRRSRYFISDLTKNDKRTERDVFTDLLALKEAWKSMWKMLVYCDMVFLDAGETVDWEWVVIDRLDTLFLGTGGLERVLGMSWMEYELERTEKGTGGFFAPK